jgi:hypothetical protein
MKTLTLFLSSLFVLAQPVALSQTRKPLSYTTPPKPAQARLKVSESEDFAVPGRAAFTVAAALDDDTLTGTFVYELPAAAREKLATLTGKPLELIPALLAKKEVRARFQKDSACPLIHWECAPELIEVFSAQLRFAAVVLDVPETPEYLPQLFCNWARQINVQRQRRGIIAAINRALQGEEAEAPERKD